MLTSTVGYVRISQFAENTADDFATQFKELQAQGMKALVLDLRDNPGGLLSTTEKNIQLYHASRYISNSTKSGW